MNPGDSPKDTSVEINMGNAWAKVDAMLDGFVALLPNIALAVVFFLAMWGVAHLVSYLFKSRAEGRDRANLGEVGGRLIYYAIMAIGFMFAVTIVAPTVKPGDLLAGLGVGSVAIGFAFKDILQNLLAGVLILIRQPFEIGDQIVSGSHEGTVEKIETRATILKTYDGRRVVVPNSEIYTNEVVVNTAHELVRSQYDVGVGYGDDLDTAKKAMLEAMKSVDGVVAEPAPEVLTWELAGSSVNLRARWWTTSERADVVHTWDAVLKAMKLALDDAAVDMPYPTKVVLWHNQTEEVDGDRTKQREGWPAGDNPPGARPLTGEQNAS